MVSEFSIPEVGMQCSNRSNLRLVLRFADMVLSGTQTWALSTFQACDLLGSFYEAVVTHNSF